MKYFGFQTRRRIVRLRRISHWWPWVVSVAVHCTALGILSVVVLVSYNTKAEQPEIIPEARLGKVSPGLPLFQKIRQDIDLPQDTTFAKNLREQVAPKEFSTGMAKKLSAGGSGNKEPFIAIGVPSAGMSNSFLAGRNDTGHTPLSLPGGDLARLQPSAPVTRFFASGGNAYQVVYLVDRSASMIDSIEPLKRELKRSISGLQPMQKFHIIFFSAGKPAEGPAGELTWATDRNKEKYFKFIDSIGAQGQTDPQWALQRALELKPDLIYLLTDGIFSEKIAEKIIEGAKAHKIKINTIAYVWESGGSLLRRIAEQTGGIYKFVSGEQLQ